MSRKNSALILSVIAFIVTASDSYAARCKEDDISISMVRAVGDYPSSTAHASTVEIWTGNRPWCNLVACTSKNRAVVDSKHAHVISAAYMAFASGKKVNITIDDALTTRNGICEITHIDVVN